MELPTTQPSHDIRNMNVAIQHDIENIDALNAFLEGDAEICLHTLLADTGTFIDSTAIQAKGE